MGNGELSLEQAQRFYETLAILIGKREGVEIKVTVTPMNGEETISSEDKQFEDKIKEAV